MTNIFKYLPRSGEMPELLRQKGQVDGIDLTHLDEALEIWGEVNGRPSEDVHAKYQNTLDWYMLALSAYEAEVDPQGIAEAERAELIRRDFDALCPSIATISGDAFDAAIEGRSKRFSLVLLYSSPGCPWCVPLAETLEALAPEMDDFRFIKVCHNLDPDVLKRFRISTFPTMLLFENGKLRTLTSGALSPEQIRAWLAPTLNVYRAKLDRRQRAYALEQSGLAEQPVCIDGVCEVPAKV